MKTPDSAAPTQPKHHGFSDFWKIARALVTWEMLIKGLNIGSSLILIRLMAVADYGEYSYYFSISNTLIAIFSSGVQVVYLRNQAYANSTGKLRLDQFLISIIIELSFFALVFAGVVAVKGVNGLWLSAVAYALGFSLFTLSASHFQAVVNFKGYGLLGALKNVSLFAIIGGLALMGGLKTNPVQVSFAAIHIVFFLAACRFIGLSSLSEIKIGEFLGLLKENLPLLFYYGAAGLFTQADILLIERNFPLEPLAIYGVAFRYYMFSLVILAPLTNSIRVYTSTEAMVSNRPLQLAYFKSWMKKILKYGLPLLIVGLLAGGPVMRLVNGVKYDESVTLMRILMAGAFCTFLFAPAVSIILTSKNYTTLAVFMSISTVMKFGLVYLGAAQGSLLLVATASVASIIFMNLLNASYVFFRQEKTAHG